MKFLLRDDDTSAMTRPEELEACYSDIWDDVPICLSVTPFRIPGRTTGVPEALLDCTEVLPLARNTELVAFLREQIARGRIDIALHGYHHDRSGGQAEFVGASDLDRKAREGRAYLEDVLGCDVTTFVPPNNALSGPGFDAVVGAGMDIINNQTRARLRPWWTGIDAMLETLAAARYALQTRLGRSNRYFTRSFPGYRQAPYHTVGPDLTFELLRESLEECRRLDGVFVLATHYHAFGRRLRSGETIREGVMRLVDSAREYTAARFVDYDGLW